MRFTAADGVSLHFTDEGPRDGKVVLCLSGLTRNGTDFDYVAPHLGDVRLIRMDYRGRGRSDWAEPATYTVPVEAGDALALLDHLGIGAGGGAGDLARRADRHGAGGDGEGAADGRVPQRHRAGDRARRGLRAIRDFIGQPPGFRTYEEAAVARSRFMAGFDGVPMERWRAEAAKHYVEGPEGLAINYDPAAAGRVPCRLRGPCPGPLAGVRCAGGPAARADPGGELGPAVRGNGGRDAAAAAGHAVCGGARPGACAVS